MDRKEILMALSNDRERLPNNYEEEIKMLRSLYSGVSGMKNLQVKMDVVSNNIANVNTTAFKSSRVMFQDMMNQTVANATAPEGNIGGVNGKQIGLGVQVGSIDTMTGTGASQTTGRALDFYIAGSGYFMVQGSGANPVTYYTRDGAFLRDSKGNLTNSAGMKVLGRTSTNLTTPTEYNSNTPDAGISAEGTTGALVIPSSIKVEGQVVNFSTMAVDANGLVTAKYGDKTYTIGKVSIATFNNPEGLEHAGGNNYIVSNNSGAAIVGGAGDNGSGKLQPGALEMSNVDLSTEFTEMIIASRAYQANSRSITTSDEMLQELINLKR